MTDAKQVVARQITRSGHILLAGLEPLGRKKFYRENPDGFSAAWTVGHLACVADLFSSWLGDRRLVLSRPTHQVFNETALTGPCPVSKAASVDRETFSKEVLLQMYCQATEKALRELSMFDVSRWDDPSPPVVPVTMLTRGAVWEHLAAHGYWHLGELAGSMPVFAGTYTMNITSHHLYVQG